MNNSKKRRLMLRNAFKASPNINYLIVAIGVIFIWRAIWGFSDLYLFPDNPTASYIVCFIIGLVILYIDDWSLDEMKK